MKIGIVGYQGSGKSTLFGWLTGTAPDPASAHSGQLAAVEVPDARVDRLCEVYAPKKIVLASIELAIPKPVPFLRLGLANLPILIALQVLRPRQLLLLLGLKILGQGMVQGTLFSYIILFSAASSVASVAAMWLVDRASRGLMSLVGVAVVGAHAGPRGEVDNNRLFRQRVSIIGCSGSTRSACAESLRLAGAGAIVSPLDSVMPIDAVAAAYRRLQSRENHGKIVMRVADDIE